MRSEGRQALSDSEWQYVQEQRWTDEENSLIVLNVIEARKVFGTDTRVEAVKLERGVPSSRKYALSLLIAKQVRVRPDVCQFRKEQLGGTVLQLAQIKDWVLHKAASDGKPTIWANEVPLPAGSEPQFDEHGLFTVPIGGVVQSAGIVTKYLCFPCPDHSVSCVPVHARGTLHLLHQLATTLSQTFHWTEAEAVMLVLADEVPPVQPAKCHIHWSAIPCLSRVTLTLDPALSSRQVESLYRRVRGQVLEGRYRNLSRKHALLAGFTSTLGGLKLSEQMNKWNEQYRQWRYTTVTIFGRDAKTARDRLLTPSNFSVQSLVGRDHTKGRKAPGLGS